MGTTSAYAENTRAPACMIMVAGNYLRVRGEYFVRVKIRVKTWELPPRTRRIRFNKENILSQLGNYLRVRGEYAGDAVVYGL